MITNKEDFFNSLSFIGSQRHSERSNADISIVNSQNRFLFTFRNECDAKIGEGDRIEIARYKNRMIFRKSKSGMKLYSPESLKPKYTKWVENPDNKWISLFEGSHELKYDDLYEYYYIDVEIK